MITSIKFKTNNSNEASTASTMFLKKLNIIGTRNDAVREEVKEAFSSEARKNGFSITFESGVTDSDECLLSTVLKLKEIDEVGTLLYVLTLFYPSEIASTVARTSAFYHENKINEMAWNNAVPDSAKRLISFVSTILLTKEKTVFYIKDLFDNGLESPVLPVLFYLMSKTDSTIVATVKTNVFCGCLLNIHEYVDKLLQKTTVNFVGHDDNNYFIVNQMQLVHKE